MEIQIENLRAKMRGEKLNHYQEGLALDEFEKLIAHTEALTEQLRQYNAVGQSEQFYCTCSRAKGLDYDEEGTPYCISCQKEVQ